MLQPAEAGAIVFGPFPTQPVKQDGSFQLEDVGPDRYNLAVNGLPEGFYVNRIRSANLDVLAEGLDLAGGSPAPLDVVLSPKAGQVSGTVMDPKTQKPAAGDYCGAGSAGEGAARSRVVLPERLLRMRPASSRSRT